MSGLSDLMLEITPEVLLKAYSCGIFPMAETADDPGLFWVEPRQRGIIPLDDFHIPRRLRRTIRQAPFDIVVNQDFAQVISLCAEQTHTRRQTWINGRITELYTELHRMGHAHSIECWQGSVLVGGLYGVHLAGAFFGESMFSRCRDASKVALVHLVERLRAGRFQLLDTQFNTDHLRQFGAIDVPKLRYEDMLEEALAGEGDFYAFDRLDESG